MGTALHTIRVDHFNLGSMLRRMVALSELVEPDNHEDLRASIALVLRFVAGPAASRRRRQTEALLREALFKAALDAAPDGRIASIEPRIRAGLKRELLSAFDALASVGGQGARFRAAAKAYADFERWRMLQVETQVIPLAVARLGPEDWTRIDAAVARLKAGDRSRDREAERLFRAAVEAAQSAQRVRRQAAERRAGKGRQGLFSRFAD